VNIKRLAYPKNEFRRQETGATEAEVRSQETEVRMSASIPDRGEIAAAVERFLAKRGASAPTPVAPTQALTPASPAPEPAIAVVDFVCEDDVRRAVKDSKKIFIGPKTIVTPSARDLANQHDVLVLTSRK
jgi:hypothetical protein